MCPSARGCCPWTIIGGGIWKYSPGRRKKYPEIIGGRTALQAFIHEYLFVSLFRACAESLASENASRLAAMQRAEKNIDELLEDLNTEYHRLRQSGIDAESFDVIAGFEALNEKD
jgi:F-type H+-transporting ATPase subunit gamma